MNNRDLISQYVNIGFRLPEYQVNKLSSNDLKTYLRIRVIMVANNTYDVNNELLTYEYLKMDDIQRDTFVKTLKVGNIETCMMTLNWRGYSDDFVTRLIRLKSSSDIKDNVIYILRNTRSPVSVIYDILNTHGTILNENRIMSYTLSKFDTDNVKLKFCMEYIKLLNNTLKRNMSVINSPIKGMLDNLNNDDNDAKTLRKYFISLNLKNPNGVKIDSDTFFTLLNKMSDSGFIEVSDFMVQNLTLSPNQLDFINKEKI
jgi:hypothetical protein